MSKSNGNPKDSSQNPPAISTIAVAGFKSILDEQTLEVRPLTLLAGANSSGKSSMMQPLLLLKQTLEAQYDPGPLLLNGPNAKFTSVSQFWPLHSSTGASRRFVVTIGASGKTRIGTTFVRDKKRKGLSIAYTHYFYNDHEFRLSEKTPLSEITALLRESLKAYPASSQLLEFQLKHSTMQIKRSRCFLEVLDQFHPKPFAVEGFPVPSAFSARNQTFEAIVNCLMDVIHLPGLRGNPERTYPVTAVGQTFPGRFESYVASLVAHWNSESPQKIKELGDDLRLLGLTSRIEAKRVADTQVELQVGRMPRPKQGGPRDLVSIADVGFGLSQTLPVVVALRAARPGQLVYVEQPEIHLHPRAQIAMARLLVNSAIRGVRVVAETHSSLILLGVQTLVAEGVISPDLVGLNWFRRNAMTGTSRIETAELDSAGRFGDWPEDFDDVAMKAESAYLSAAEARIARS